ncbi:MAG: hypothetical protein M1825_003550 [Sarcosagium campestre]|nr:MAG: hypothetical protein M1825_003550 [Sarcosagium campestre]
MDFETENANEWEIRTTKRVAPRPDRVPVHLLAARQPEPIQLPARPRQPFVTVRGRYVYQGHQPKNKDRDFKKLDFKNHDRFPVTHDSAARDAWRRRQDNTGEWAYKLPASYERIYESLTSGKSLPTGAKTSSNVLRTIFDKIGSKTGAFIDLPRRLSDRILLIWGAASQVTEAKKELAAWVSQCLEVNHEMWVKLPSFSQKRKKQLEEQFAEEFQRQNFRRFPEQGEKLPSIGYFLWPLSDIRPESFLGNNLEALDDVRVSSRCYIAFETEFSRFKVQAWSLSFVPPALARLRITLCEIITRSVPSNRIYVMEPLSPESPKQVEMVNTAVLRLSPDTPDSQPPIARTLPLLVGPAPDPSERAEWSVLKPDFAANNARFLRQVVLNTLSDLSFYRGNIQARVHFGVMALSVYKRPEKDTHLSVEDFADMIRKPQMQGRIIRSIEREESGKRLRASFCRATDLFHPRKALTLSLEDIEPEYSASFMLNVPDDPNPILLDVDFAKVLTGGYEVRGRQWTRAETISQTDVTADLNCGRVPLAAITIDLQRQTAWQFEITTRNTIEESRVTSQMQKFVAQLKLSLIRPPGADASEPSNAYVRLGYAGLRVQTQVVKTTRKYMLRGGNYVTEIVKCQRTSKPTGTTTDEPVTSWQVSMYSNKWTTVFGSQPSLRIGTRGSWQPDVDDFFAPLPGSHPGSGLSDFLDEVRVVARVIASRERDATGVGKA